jgi:anti-sigma factor RsiW
MPSITCRQFIEFLDGYLSGGQANHVRAEFERHVSVCRACADYLHTYREAVKLGKGAFEVDPDARVPMEVPNELVQAVLAITTGRPCVRSSSKPTRTSSDDA